MEPGPVTAMVINNAFAGVPVAMAAADESGRGSDLLSRRSSGDGAETARQHSLYKVAHPHPGDGLYHCPWEGSPQCGHKPEKLKCNYDKFVDSHLKPYKCKVDSCGNAQFSSTACLLRHEREAHAMHGHGDKPFRCTYPGCERGLIGHGFPRQWNLRDHMRRVHNDNPPRRASSPGVPKPAGAGAKNRKRKGETPTVRKTPLKATAESSGRRSSAARYQLLVKEWFAEMAALREHVGHIDQPDSAETIGAIKNVQDKVSRLSNISRSLVYPHEDCRMQSVLGGETVGGAKGF